MTQHIDTWNLLKSYEIETNEDTLLELHQLASRRRSTIENFLRSCTESKSTESACYIVKREIRQLGLDYKTQERFITFIDEFQSNCLKLKVSAFQLIQRDLTPIAAHNSSDDDEPQPIPQEPQVRFSVNLARSESYRPPINNNNEAPSKQQLVKLAATLPPSSSLDKKSNNSNIARSASKNRVVTFLPSQSPAPSPPAASSFSNQQLRQQQQEQHENPSSSSALVMTSSSGHIKYDIAPVTLGYLPDSQEHLSSEGINHKRLFEEADAHLKRTKIGVPVTIEFATLPGKDGERFSPLRHLKTFYKWNGHLHRDKVGDMYVTVRSDSPDFANVVDMSDNHDPQAGLPLPFPHSGMHYKSVVLGGLLLSEKLSTTAAASSPRVASKGHRTPSVGSAVARSEKPVVNKLAVYKSASVASPAPSRPNQKQQQQQQQNDDDDDYDTASSASAVSNATGAVAVKAVVNKLKGVSTALVRVPASKSEAADNNNNNKNNNKLILKPIINNKKSKFNNANTDQWFNIVFEEDMTREEVHAAMDLYLRDSKVGQDFCSKTVYLQLSRDTVEDLMILGSRLPGCNDVTSDENVNLVYSLMFRNLMMINVKIHEHVHKKQVNVGKVVQAMTIDSIDPFSNVLATCEVPSFKPKRGFGNNNNNNNNYNNKKINFNKRKRIPGYCDICLAENNGVLDEAKVKRYDAKNGGCVSHGLGNSKAAPRK
jgi:hypothetical protein